MSDKALKIIGIILLVIGIIIIIVLGSKNHKGFNTISSKEAYKMMKNDVVVLDVRTKEEYDEGHIKNAINIPVDDIESIDVDKNKTILVYCRSGNRSKQASQKLTGLGYENIYDFGGIIDWPYEVVK